MKTRGVFFAGNDTFKMHVMPLFEDAMLHETNSIRDAGIVYVTFGCHFGPLKNINHWLSNKLFIIHWIGSDVPRWEKSLNSPNPLLRLYYQYWRMMIKRRLKRKQLISLAVTEHLADGLKKVGIPAEVFPITSVNNSSIALAEKLKKEDRSIDFIAYIPTNNFVFYGGTWFLECATRLPHRNFLLINPDIDKMDASFKKLFPENVQIMPEVGFDAMQALFADARFLLRLTQHDGLSLMVLEALLAEMQVYWTRHFPHTNHVSLPGLNPADLAAKIDKHVADWKKNEEGKRFVINTYNIDSFQHLFNELLK